MINATAIVLAAGEGRRLGGDTPKTYLPIAGRPLVLRTLDRMFSASSVEAVVLVVAAEQKALCESLLQSDAALQDRRWLLQTGGATRQESARRGLARVGSDAATEKQAVVVGLPVRDTIKAVSTERWILSTPERSMLWEIQTPQVFKRELIVAAHARAVRDGAQVTDDAMVVERIGTPVYVLEGERTNFKITVPEDVWLAETLIREGRLT
jgi:2-C-methyl-D-erythritol 4-phosphate cytidylyltransferase